MQKKSQPYQWQHVAPLLDTVETHFQNVKEQLKLQ